MGTFEDQYNNTLLSLELTLVRPYRQREDVTDWDTLTAVKGAIRTYTAQQRRRSAPNLKLNPIPKAIYDELIETCEGWLGHKPFTDPLGETITLTDNALTVSEIIACLKRIQRSIEMWQKEGGRRGYFEFIDQFLSKK
jgi:hypothetical protein